MACRINSIYAGYTRSQAKLDRAEPPGSPHKLDSWLDKLDFKPDKLDLWPYTLDFVFWSHTIHQCFFGKSADSTSQNMSRV